MLRSHILAVGLSSLFELFLSGSAAFAAIVVPTFSVESPTFGTIGTYTKIISENRFTLNDARLMAIAGLWREGQGNRPPTFTMLTTEPGPDVAPIHNRQVVVLRPDDWVAWLDLLKPEAVLLRPLPQGSLSVETVRPGSQNTRMRDE